jgi:hypothetical protein
MKLVFIFGMQAEAYFYIFMHIIFFKNKKYKLKKKPPTGRWHCMAAYANAFT